MLQPTLDLDEFRPHVPDLGRMEWAGTKELAAAQAQHFGVRFLVVRKDGGDLLSYIRKRGMWPAPRQRYCTSDFKRGPIRKAVTRLAREHRAFGRRPVRVLSCLGFRAEESPTIGPMTWACRACPACSASSRPEARSSWRGITTRNCWPSTSRQSARWATPFAKTRA